MIGAASLIIRRLLRGKRIKTAGPSGLIESISNAVDEDRDESIPDDLLTGDPVKHQRSNQAHKQAFFDIFPTDYFD